MVKRSLICEILLLKTTEYTCAVADSFVLDNVLVLQRLEDLDLPLKLPDVLGGAVLQLLHRHHLPRVVLQGVVPAHLHAAEVALMEEMHTHNVSLPSKLM